jgi:thioredoxin reductase
MNRNRNSSGAHGDGVVDVVIVGGGPAGLSAALTLGRARRRVLLSDGGPRRNAAAEHIHGFVTRDGTTPADFRRIGRQQLEPYGGVEARDAGIEAIGGQRGAFEVRLATGEVVTARRILLCTGMIDELPEIEGFQALWGRGIFICPYCHGWEVQDRAWGFLAPSADALDFALLLRAWASDLVVLTDGRYAVPAEARARLQAARVRIDERPIARLVGRDGQLERVELRDGDRLPLAVLFARPPQRQVAIVQSLGLALDGGGYLQLNEQGQTSIPGIYAAGDLVTPVQGAILAAASAMRAAALLNHELMVELATAGALP